MAKSKKIAIVVAAIALIAVIGVVGSTLAYFTDTDQQTNTFTMGNVNGQLLEKDDPDGDPIAKTGIEFKNVTPNQSLTKIAYMKLGSDSSKAYARMKLTWQFGDKTTDTAVQEKIKALENDPNAMEINPNWVKSGDYYYYQGELDKNGETEPIFTKINIPSSWDNDMTNAEFSLKLDGHFIQADNIKDNLTYNTDGKIVGWPVTDDQMKAYDPNQNK